MMEQYICKHHLYGERSNYKGYVLQIKATRPKLIRLAVV